MGDDEYQRQQQEEREERERREREENERVQRSEKIRIERNQRKLQDARNRGDEQAIEHYESKLEKLNDSYTAKYGNSDSGGCLIC